MCVGVCMFMLVSVWQAQLFCEFNVETCVFPVRCVCCRCGLKIFVCVCGLNKGRRGVLWKTMAVN